MAAAFAVFAILIQALLPGAAHAAMGSGPGSQMVVCAIDGGHTVRVDHVPIRSKGFAGLPCPDCLTAAVAVVLATPAAQLFVPTVYVRTGYLAGPAVRLALARAPPRPPGQGPPTA